MQKPYSALLIWFVLPLGAAAQPLETGFCIENQSRQPALFAVDAGDGFRDLAPLPPGARLCTPEFETPTSGFVSVFSSKDAIEGCSRLAPAGSVQVLLAYNDFDNCEWQIAP